MSLPDRMGTGVDIIGRTLATGRLDMLGGYLECIVYTVIAVNHIQVYIVGRQRL